MKLKRTEKDIEQMKINLKNRKLRLNFYQKCFLPLDIIKKEKLEIKYLEKITKLQVEKLKNPQRKKEVDRKIKKLMWDYELEFLELEI